MAKKGMTRQGYFNSDPTYTAVLARFNREAKETKKREEAVKPWRVFAMVQYVLRQAGYELYGDLRILELNTGKVYKKGG